MSRAVRGSYGPDKDDETLEPLVRADDGGNPVGRIRRGDSVIFYNIRGEREIELTRSLVERDFHEFPVENDLRLGYATMIQYHEDLPVKVAFPPEGKVRDSLCEVLAQRGKRQIKITEAEKAVHLSFFLDGKSFQPFTGEERSILPTRKDVVLFDEAPEMSIEKIRSTVIDALRDVTYDFVVVNLPNVDVVGHIENESAIRRAVEVVDETAGILLDEAGRAGVTTFVTADHGTVEKWLYPDGAIDTGHTDSPVPFMVVTGTGQVNLKKEGELADVAPTILQIFGIEKPAVMTGNTLLLDEHIAPSKRVMLLILDGWGLNDETRGNLIAASKTPVMDDLMRRHSVSRLAASGIAVGLPEGMVGNSEVGHLHIGAGRRVYSDRVRIDRAIADGSFFNNDAFLKVIDACKRSGGALHLMGIVSFFSSHGSVDHLYALMELARRQGVRDFFIHAMLGRRGEKPESGAIYIEKIEQKCRELGGGVVASVIGRYWSMDREENWDRIEKTYRMLVYGEGRPVIDFSAKG
ncbi:MAG: alkaline phosphatase family protein [Deltaproteobacteria bacterium]|nr:alkaline phosphatase family protein [Deltaproteobacteria bacterium]